MVIHCLFVHPSCRNSVCIGLHAELLILLSCRICCVSFQSDLFVFGCRNFVCIGSHAELLILLSCRICCVSFQSDLFVFGCRNLVCIGVHAELLNLFPCRICCVSFQSDLFVFGSIFRIVGDPLFICPSELQEFCLYWFACGIVDFIVL